MKSSTGIGESGIPGPVVGFGEVVESRFQTATQFRQTQVLDLMTGGAKGLDPDQHLPGFHTAFFREFEDPVVPTLMGFDGMLGTLAAADLAVVVGFSIALLADSIPIFRREGGAQVLAVGGGGDKLYRKKRFGLQGRFWVGIRERGHFSGLERVRRGGGSRSLEYRNGNGKAGMEGL